MTPPRCTKRSFISCSRSTRRLSGYGIMQNVERLSGGRVRLAAGTLYGALTTLTERGWIEAVGEDEGRRKEYRITPEGRARRARGGLPDCRS